MKPHPLGLWYALGFVVQGGLAVWLAPVGLLLLWPALSTGIVAAGYLGAGPGIFGKRDGRLHPLARLALGPFLAGHWIWRQKDWKFRPTHDRIEAGLLLGRCVSPREARDLLAAGVVAVVDLTCEHTEVAPFRTGVYCNVQVLDLTVPSVEAIGEAVTFALTNMTDGDVYVHCAQGKRRSAIVAAACLLAADRGLSVDDACATVSAARPLVKLGPAERERLEAYRGWLSPR